MSRNEARGHNYKAPIAAPPHVEQPDRIICKGCRQKMQAVVDPETGAPFERCYSCAGSPVAPARRRRK